MRYLTYDEAYLLHKKYAATKQSLELIFTHSRIVHEIALELIDNNKLRVDLDLVRTGALLHDIGTYTLIQENQKFLKDKYIQHGLIGAIFLKEEGFDTRVCDIVKNHIGVGITKEEIEQRNLPLPAQDYIPQTTEERLIAYADNFHSKVPQFNSFDWICQKLGEYGKQKVTELEEYKKKFGLPDLQTYSEKYKMKLI